MIIREACISDAEDIVKVSSGLDYPTSSLEIIEQRLQEIADSATNKAWVCVYKGSVVGWLHAFIALRLASDKFVEIGGLVVHDSVRNCGIGRGLVEQVRKWADEQKLDITVRCNAKRESAHTFYRAVGFQKVKSQYVYKLGLRLLQNN